MTKEEIRKIALIFETADGGCRYCALDLAAEFNRMFPDAPVKMAQLSRPQAKLDKWFDAMSDRLEVIALVPNDRAEPING